MLHSIIERAGVGMMHAFDACTGCVRRGQQNPALPCGVAGARAECARLAASPKSPPRPVVVLGGYHAWGPVSWVVAYDLRQLTDPAAAHVLPVQFMLDTSLQSCAARVIRLVRDRYGTLDDTRTVEVDAVGISMGGIVARLACAGDHAAFAMPAGLPRLNVRRIFTFGSPHRGSRIAKLVAPDRAARDMKPGSDMLARLDACLAHRDAPELTCYAQVRDHTVGALHASPPGRHPHWSDSTWTLSHFATPHNPWFQADCARRLRGDEPFLPPPHTAPPHN